MVPRLAKVLRTAPTSRNEIEMTIQLDLEDKIRKIEALFFNPGTSGEGIAAGEALRRLKEKLASQVKIEPPIPMKFSIQDEWSRQLFLALVRRYGLNPYRIKGQHRITVMVRLPQSFCNSTLWPEFQQLSRALRGFLDSLTKEMIQKAVHKDTGEAEENLQLT